MSKRAEELATSMNSMIAWFQPPETRVGLLRGFLEQYGRECLEAAALLAFEKAETVCKSHGDAESVGAHVAGLAIRKMELP